MSDVMFYGVLRMPLEMAMADEMSRYQFWQRAQEAADKIASLEAELDALKADIERYVAIASQQEAKLAALAERERIQELFKKALADKGTLWPAEIDFLYDDCFKGTP